MNIPLSVITLAVSLLSITFTIVAFVTSRKDKASEHVEEEVKQYSKHDLIEWRLNELTKKVDKILDKLDTFDKEMDEKINKAIKQHVLTCHK
ncbi:MAG: hypothetical protein J6C46_08480 [Clostridia bacterium]|nr:hypothetical protein [Clostridia bacterium]